MTIEKAVRAKIALGDIELDGFQLTDGSYHFTQSAIKNIHITLSDTSGEVVGVYASAGNHNCITTLVDFMSEALELIVLIVLLVSLVVKKSVT